MDVSCPNKACSLFGKKGMKNIVKRGWKKNGNRNYTCTACGRTFVRTAGTIFYRSRIKRKEAKQIANLLVEKNGIRSVGRVMERNRNTILRFTDRLASKCRQVNEFLLNDVKLSPVEIDELWTFIKQKKFRQEYYTNYQQGDCYGTDGRTPYLTRRMH